MLRFEVLYELNNATYSQYIAARDSAAEAASEPEKPEVYTSAEIQQVISEGRAYIKTIRDANDAIYDPVISEKLYRMEIIVQKIFEYVRVNPDQVGQLRRFMNYYMPTTEKLVRAYQQMDQETVLGENMTRAKDEIAQTLDTINDAYEKLYDSMHIDVVMDVSSDIAVLKTMFRLSAKGLNFYAPHRMLNIQTTTNEKSHCNIIENPFLRLQKNVYQCLQSRQLFSICLKYIP